MTTLVNYATDNLGVYVMLAVWVDPANSVKSRDNTAKLNIPNDAMVALWQKLAAPFVKNPHVLFAITNEPHCEDGGVCALDHDSQVRNGMAKVVQAIRSVEVMGGAPYPHVIVAQGCRNYASNVDGYIGNRLADPQVAYEAHVYANAYQSLLTAASSIPIIIGEVGPKNSPKCGLDLSFTDLEAFLTTLEQKQISYLGWTFHEYCEPNLLKVTASSKRCSLGATLSPTDDLYSSSSGNSCPSDSSVAWGCWFYNWLTTNGNKAGAIPGPSTCSSQLVFAG